MSPIMIILMETMTVKSLLEIRTGSETIDSAAN